MDEKTKETLTVTFEECGEVIVVISKILRFGFDSRYPENGEPNLYKLETELGQVLCMIELLKKQGLISETNLEIASKAKYEKLKIWAPNIVS